MKYCIINGHCVNGLQFAHDQKDMMDLKLERNLYVLKGPCRPKHSQLY